MEENSLHGRLKGYEIHGFGTLKDLDVENMMEEAKSRWLRPNEIHAVLSNNTYFTIHVKPVNLPNSGTMVLFDRKKLRNFRKDGHNWKKKKDGKTVKEAHEHLKVGTEERIHVYYAHGEDNPTFVRRCYWLLDKSLEHIVLVHYRETQEGSPAHSSPTVSDPSASWPLSEESDSADRLYYGDGNPLLERHDSLTLKTHEQRMHDINTLDWDELLVADYDHNKTSVQEGGNTAIRNEAIMLNSESTVGESLPSGETVPLQSQDSFGQWMTHMIADSPLESSVLTVHQPVATPSTGQMFDIADISPSRALSSEETKILIVGSFFNDAHLPSTDTKIFLACGDYVLEPQVVRAGVFRAIIPPQNPGIVSIYLTFDGKTPISQVLTFEFRAPSVGHADAPSSNWEEYQLKTRLARLLFSPTTNILDIFSSKTSPNILRESKSFAQKTARISQGWLYLTKMIEEDSKPPFSQANDALFEVVLQNGLREWLLEKVLLGAKVSERDEKGQGVIHLCAILGYAWAVHPFSCSGLSLDYRDKFGWTALHFAAYHGKEKMVAALLSAGAKPNLVTDPNSDNPIGYGAADLASLGGYEGLSAYLAEKALVAHLKEMTLAGNVRAPLQTNTSEVTNSGDFAEEEMYLRDALTAYRTAADAAARIHTAFREHSLRMRRKAVEDSSPEEEARCIVAAMKIQHAFRKYETRKKGAAAARIQYGFRTWKMRRDFVNMRRKAIKIQAAFRGYQMRKQYRKICWSVGVLEKAVLRWRLKRKGFRGLQVQTEDGAREGPAGPTKNEGDVIEEEFFRASRKQAEERVERSVVRVQAMFRSRKAQEEYRRMKLEHSQAKLEFEGFYHHDVGMG